MNAAVDGLPLAGNGRAFLCPECGGSRPARRRSRPRGAPLPLGAEVEADPWRGVLVAAVCAGCGYHVPGHLAELWDGQTAEGARAERRRFYRVGALREASP